MAAGVATGRHCVVPACGLALPFAPGFHHAAFGVACQLMPRHFRGAFLVPKDPTSSPDLALPRPSPVPLACHRQWPALMAWPSLPAFAAIPGQDPELPSAFSCNPFISLRLSPSVNSRLQTNGLTFPRVVKAKRIDYSLWITRITGITSLTPSPLRGERETPPAARGEGCHLPAKIPTPAPPQSPSPRPHQYTAPQRRACPPSAPTPPPMSR